FSQMPCISGNSKHRIKSKAATAACLETDGTFADALEGVLGPHRRNEQNDGPKPRAAPPFRNAGHRCKQRATAVLIRRVLVVTRGTNTGRSIQGVHFQA